MTGNNHAGAAGRNDPLIGQLFQPLQLGSLLLPNRILMAPLTRARATVDHVPTQLMAEYYAQRADSGLIISEAIAIEPLGMGWYRAPGLWTDAMVAGWRQITDAVHAAGGRIFAQLWHMGRLVLPAYLDGALPVGPSALAADGSAFVPPGPDYQGGFLPMQPYVVPRAMTTADIHALVAAYGRAAARAVEAGFDGVELHAANGYILDQFLQSNSNHRTDCYGGNVANRTRLLREVLEAVLGEVQAGRVSIRISPTSARKGMGDENPPALAEAVAQLARQYGVACLHLIEPVAAGFADKPEQPVVGIVRAAFDGTLVQNGSFDAASAGSCIASGQADAVSFGRPYIANPDLVARIEAGRPFATPDFDFAYVGEAQGYTDYPPAGA